MQLTRTERAVRYVTMKLSGRLDAFHAPKVRAELEQLRAEGVRHFVFDLSQLEFLDSAGLAVFVTVLKQVQQEDGSAKMVLPEAHAARRIIHLTHFDRIFEVVASH